MHRRTCGTCDLLNLFINDYLILSTNRGWSELKEALILYNNLKGDLNIPCAYIVPESQLWPTHLWYAQTPFIYSSTHIFLLCYQEFATRRAGQVCNSRGVSYTWVLQIPYLTCFPLLQWDTSWQDLFTAAQGARPAGIRLVRERFCSSSQYWTGLTILLYSSLSQDN